MLPALLAEVLNEPIFVTIDGERRQITTLDPGLRGKQRRKKTRKIMVATLERLERKDA